MIIYITRMYRWILLRYLKSIPDQDEYAIPYSILADVIKSLAPILEELPEEMASSKEDVKNNPEQTNNDRAKQYAFYE